MPRDRSRALASEVVANGFFASASRKSIRKPGSRHKVQTSKWQDESWLMFDTVGEYHSACTWISNMVSKAKLVLMYDGQVIDTLMVESSEQEDAEREDVELTEATLDIARRAIESLYGGPEEQPEMLRLFALHLTVAGDCYLVGVSGGEDDDDEWEIYSNLRISASTDWYQITDTDGTGAEEIDRNALVMRLWRKHPLERKKGDSNARAALPILRELDVMTQRVAADSESRLTGAGLLLLPSEVTFPSRIQVKEGEDGAIESTTTGLDAFMELLIQVASMSISDQGSAAAKVPIVLQMPGDQISKVKLINFWSEYDQQMKELRNEAIRRLSLAMDMPPEVLTGMADANHWTAWQMEEAAIKVHTEPLLKLITGSLNEGYLWPYLVDEGIDEDEARRYTIGVDTSEMRLRPNRSKEAIELHDRALLSDEAVLRENGFKPSDLMTDEQRRQWVLRKLSQGSPSPGMVAAAVAALGVDTSQFLDIMREVDSGGEQGTEDRPLTRSLDEHPVNEIPNTQDAVAAASEVIVMRVLERAGNRLKNRMGSSRPTDVPAHQLYLHTVLKPGDLDDLLEDAFGICDQIETKVPVEQLNSYVRSLLLNANPHEPATLRRFLHLAEYALRSAA